MEYLTDQDYKIAEENGISYKNAYQRFHDYGWSKEKTITTPIRKMTNPYKEWIKIAESNGINRFAFKSRMQIGWTPEEAASLPIGTIRNKLKEQADERPAL